ncbi:hypothetical protein F5887DRAFT_1002910 [Amanita rubescens]|nr:hypothetical protein F5887DRAFT_1002910 [Amanita rubescens]
MDNVQQWARVHRLNGGDDMRAAGLNFVAEDRRDATFVRVSDVIVVMRSWRLRFIEVHSMTC